MPIKLIVSDLDGTLLTEKKVISDYTKEALMYAIEKGCHFIPATGRALGAVPKEVLHFPGVEYVITSNGAAVYSVSEGKRVYQCRMCPGAIETVAGLPRYPEAALEIFIEGIPYGQEDYIQEPERFGATPFGAAYVKKTRISVKDIYAFDLENREKIDSIAFATADPAVKEKIRSMLLKEVKDIYVTSSVSHMLEAGHINAGKGNTLSVMLKRLGITEEEAMAFGDGDNDMEMLSLVKYGIAMKNGSENCKKSASYITETNEQNGVGKAIYKFVL